MLTNSGTMQGFKTSKIEMPNIKNSGTIEAGEKVEFSNMQSLDNTGGTIQAPTISMGGATFLYNTPESPRTLRFFNHHGFSVERKDGKVILKDGVIDAPILTQFQTQRLQEKKQEMTAENQKIFTKLDSIKKGWKKNKEQFWIIVSPAEKNDIEAKVTNLGLKYECKKVQNKEEYCLYMKRSILLDALAVKDVVASPL